MAPSAQCCGTFAPQRGNHVVGTGSALAGLPAPDAMFRTQERNLHLTAIIGVCGI